MLTAMTAGFALGMRHALDPDHVVAVTTLVARHQSPWSASWVGASWGAGHALTILVAGGLLVALRAGVPAGLAASAEGLVGVLLAALGAANVTAALRSPLAPDAAGGRMRSTLRRSVLAGLVHGLAGSGAVAILASAAMPSVGAAIAYLAVFGFGTVTGMVACSVAVGAPLAAFVTSPRGRRALGLATGLVSIGFGVHLLRDVGWLGAFGA